MAFPSRGLIFKDSVDRVRDTVARPSLDTFYQVDFSFGKESRWLEGSIPGKKRTQGSNFKTKMSLLCTQAELPGTSFIESSVTGNFQGITELFPNLRNFPPLNLTFYVDADHVILEVLERWMEYINPVQTNKRDLSAFTRFNYPEDYKEIIHITKFERDSFNEKKNATYQSNMTSYEFVNVWPQNLTSMRLAYGDPNVLKCNISLAYDRFFTKFDYKDSNQAVLNNPSLVNSNDQQIQPFPVRREDGRFTTTGTTSILPLGGV